jgi:hypothetical protein
MTNELMSKQDAYAPIRKEHVSLAQISNEIASKIKDHDTLKEAVDFLIRIKSKRKQWKDFIKPALEAAYLAHKRIKDIEKEIDLPLERAEDEILKPAISKFEIEATKAREIKQEAISKETGVDVLLQNEAKVDGITFKTNYSAEVVDIMALAKAVVAGAVPAEALKGNYPFLNATAKSLKTAMNWPGVKLIAERVVSARTKSGIEEEL